MKKLFNAFFALLVSVSLSLVGSVNVFAAEETDVHTIEIEVAPNSSYTATPYMWDQGTYSVSGNSTINTSTFTVEHRYFAFETSATNSNGNAMSGTCSVVLYYSIPMVSICGISFTADGKNHKEDWIDLGASNQSCVFSITNKSSETAKVKLTYYSWA